MNFLTKLDRNRFTSLPDELTNDLTKGINNYPADIIDTMQLAQTYRSDGKVIEDMTSSNRENSETAYVTSSYNQVKIKIITNENHLTKTEKAKATFPEKSPKANATFSRRLVTGRTLSLSCPKKQSI